jgi:diaminobutyrate-2-oxoglutarate transaminase
MDHQTRDVASEKSVAASSSGSLQQRHSQRGGLYGFDETPILARQQRRESNARSYPRRLPIALKRAQGMYVEDMEGRVFIDCLSAAGTLILGHNHPVVVEAIERALRSQIPMQTLDLTTPIKDEFVEELMAFLPAELGARARIQFCGPTGTDAVEAAIKLVRTAKGRTNMLAFHGAYHGMSAGALALMGNLGPKVALAGSLQHVQFLPYPYDYRCPFSLGGRAGEAAGIAYIENVLSDPESGVLPPAGMILEAVQGEGGVVPAPIAWLRKLRAVATAADVPLILDEVQTGFGRTGRRFAFEHAGIKPDVVVLSKALGGGLPLSVIVYDEALDRWQPGAHAGTFRGNQLAMVSGLATMRIVKQERLELHAWELGQRMMGKLAGIQKRTGCIGEIRGMGLMIGMEIVDPDGTVDRQGHPPASRELARAIQAACLRHGLILELGGRHGATVRLLPPLIITQAEIDIVVQTIDAAVDDALRERQAPTAGQA